MLFLTFFLDETYQRSKLPPYVWAKDGEELENYALDLRGLVFLYLWVALLCLILVIYCLHTMPKKKELLRRFLEEGQSIVGDVFYPEDQTCYGLNAQYGTVTYADPRAGSQHSYIRRSARLYEHFSREWVPVLVLPERPYSGHPKADIEVAYLATDRQKPALEFLAVYSTIWMVGNTAAAIYALSVVMKNKYEDEFDRGWMWFSICLIIMPFAAVAANILIFQRHMRWMTKGDSRILEKGEKANEEATGREPDDSSLPAATSEYQQMADSERRQRDKGEGGGNSQVGTIA